MYINVFLIHLINNYFSEEKKIELIYTSTWYKFLSPKFEEQLLNSFSSNQLTIAISIQRDYF